jgi:hypothetical protein
MHFGLATALEVAGAADWSWLNQLLRRHVNHSLSDISGRLIKVETETCLRSLKPSQ